jgi:hypothetical protein
LIEPAINAGQLLHPLPSFGMFQVEDVVERPVKVVSQVGYLLLQAIRGVA